ncbi:hypothetical protein [Cytobacillus sp.]|uniref:hypothetical protein n=1 Tax=Cytobacillus sp. TaxID=2675269 RepID=UPI0028BEE6A0|nr:hypothetical protein [Cytobacillus sp.]
MIGFTFVTVFSLVIGLASGMIMGKLMFLLSNNILQFEVSLTIVYLKRKYD